MSKSLTSETYAAAGVDIDAGRQLVRRIAPLAKATRRIGATVELGGFGGLFDLAACKFDDPVLVAANDGVGTKLKIAIETGRHDTVGIDLVAMCVNDLIVQGAEPLFFLDYFATGKLMVDTAETVIGGIAEGCKQANCALIGGETAEMPDMYAAGDYDLAGFAVGAVERKRVLPHNVAAGDILLGLTSSGVHANGFSLIRRLVQRANLDWNDPAPTNSGKTLVEELLTPTRIYVRSVLATLKASPNASQAIHGLVHITGGGFQENLPRVLADNLTAEIDLGAWQRPPIFDWIQETGKIADMEMLRTFNCGIGMVLIVAADEVTDIVATLVREGETVLPIGRLIAGQDAPVIFTR